MAKVVLTTGLAQQFTGGRTDLDIEASAVRELLKALDAAYPGLGSLILDEMAIAIDGEIYQDPYLESIQPTSEVFILPKLGGGC